MSLLDDKLETFIAVCEVKNFTKAGEMLGLTQPAVSQHIKKLEEELDTQIFLRKKGEITLSQEGEIALLYAKRMHALQDKMRDKIKSAKANIRKIRIGITHTQESGYMIEALSKMALAYENLNITFITDTIKNLYAMLENFELDVLIIEEKPSNPDFNFMVLDTDMLTCMVSSQNPLAQKQAITLNELKKQHLILRLPTSATRVKFASSLEAIGESIDNFDVVIEVDSIATIKNLVKKDIGVSILSKGACVKELKKKSLVALPIENLSMTRETTIVYHKTFNHVEIIERIAAAYHDIARQ
mgnify:FL=1